MVVWKYVISRSAIGAGEVAFPMPAGAEVLTVQAKGDSGVLWALVDPAASKETRRFRVVPTGGPPSELKAEWYVGTFQLGWTVWHVFEVLR
jgi:hypothetical protein